MCSPVEICALKNFTKQKNYLIHVYFCEDFFKAMSLLLSVVVTIHLNTLFQLEYAAALNGAAYMYVSHFVYYH